MTNQWFSPHPLGFSLPLPGSVTWQMCVILIPFPPSPFLSAHSSFSTSPSVNILINIPWEFTAPLGCCDSQHRFPASPYLLG
ncbi:hypothetical protein FKM82_004642 [Ascaphus truei]